MDTTFTNLVGCTAPIQLAGMGPVCSDELCAAVSEAGGLGMITVAATSPDTLEGRLDHIRRLTSRPVGTNFLVPAVDRECLRIALLQAPDQLRVAFPDGGKQQRQQNHAKSSLINSPSVIVGRSARPLCI